MITDLSTTAASNSPAGSDSPVDGDNFIRALSAFVASLQTGSGNGVTAITSPGFIPNSATIPTNGLYLKAANNPALSSNTTLRWDVGSAGNHVFAAPSSGVALTVTGVGTGSNAALQVNAGGSTLIASFDTTVAAGSNVTWTSSGTFRGLVGIGPNAVAGAANADFGISPGAGGNVQIGRANGTAIGTTFGPNGNVTIAAPSSGTAVTVSGLTKIGTGAAIPTQGTLLVNNPNATDTRIQIFQDGQESWAIGMTASNTTLRFRASGVDTLTIASAGNVTIAAPSAGVGLTQTGFAGSDTAIFNGGTSGSFRVNTTGVPYGTSLHNNAGAVTGTTNQYITSGTYTPTFATTSNITGTPTVASSTWKWTRVGNTVIVSGNISANPTAAANTATLFRATLPIASAFASAGDCNGSLCAVGLGGVVDIASNVQADAANDALSFSFGSGVAGTRTFTFIAQYEVL